MNGLFFIGNGHLLNPGPEAFSDYGSSQAWRILQQDNKFNTPVPGKQVRLPQIILTIYHKLFEDSIAGIVTVFLIDLFEFVDVNMKDR